MDGQDSDTEEWQHIGSPLPQATTLASTTDNNVRHNHDLDHAHTLLRTMEEDGHDTVADGDHTRHSYRGSPLSTKSTSSMASSEYSLLGASASLSQSRANSAASLVHVREIYPSSTSSSTTSVSSLNNNHNCNISNNLGGSNLAPLSTLSAPPPPLDTRQQQEQQQQQQEQNTTSSAQEPQKASVASSPQLTLAGSLTDFVANDQSVSNNTSHDTATSPFRVPHHTHNRAEAQPDACGQVDELDNDGDGDGDEGLFISTTRLAGGSARRERQESSGSTIQPKAKKSPSPTIEDEVDEDEVPSKSKLSSQGSQGSGSTAGISEPLLRRRWQRTPGTDNEEHDDGLGYDDREAKEEMRRAFLGAFQGKSTTMPGEFLDASIDGQGNHPDKEAKEDRAPVNEMPVEERQCRICLGGPEDEMGRLISPCLCKGTMKYVHLECLNEWRAMSATRESHFKCGTCHYAFSFQRTRFAKYLSHPATILVVTLITFLGLVFLAGFVIKLILYLTMDGPYAFIYPIDPNDDGYNDEYDLDLPLETTVLPTDGRIVFKTPDTLRAVFNIDKTHMAVGSFFVGLIGLVQLMLSMVWMGGGGIFRIGGFGLGGGGGRGRDGRRRVERQGDAGVGGVLLAIMLVVGLFKSIYMTYQFVNKVSRRLLAKAELMILDVQ